MEQIAVDIDYPRVFHSPGLEPWILGTIRMIKHKFTLLDLGCGYGFWGFVCKVRSHFIEYSIGLDINLNRLRQAKIIYDDTVQSDVRLLPFRSNSIDVVLAVEVLHGLNSNDFKNCLTAISNITNTLIIITLPVFDEVMYKIVNEFDFLVYRYILRGFLLITNRKVLSMYNTIFFRLLGASC